MKLRTVRILNLIFCSVLILGAFLSAFLSEDYHPSAFLVLSLLALGMILFNLIFCRCPHCNTYLWRVTWAMDFCPYCGKTLKEEENAWYTDYERINYMQGTPAFFKNGGEDMILVTYKDGMRIHVGYDKTDSMFVISVLADDSRQAKEQPLAVHRVFGKTQLLTALQNTVHTWRDERIG